MFDLSPLATVRKTERLLLRPFLSEDADAFYACLTSPDALNYENRAPLTKEDAQREVEARANDAGSIAICLPPTEAAPWGRLIGFVTVYEVDDCILLGYLVTAEEQKKGYAREACTAVLSELFSIGISAVLALSETENKPSTALLLRLGFTLCETYQNEIGHEVGVYLCDAQIFTENK